MAENRPRTIGDLCKDGLATVQTGPFGSQLHSYDYVEHGVPVVPTEAILRRRIDLQRANHVTAETAARLDRHRLRRGDILFARRGIQATGLSAIVRDDQEDALCGTGAILLRLKKDNRIVDPAFLSFVLATDESIAWFKQHAVGAVMPNLNDSIIKHFPLALPAVEKQREIARSLGFFDQKIELNRAMSHALEAFAAATFKSWFVDFDPVLANSEGRQLIGIDAKTASQFPAAYVDSEAGRVPMGWETGGLPDFIDVNPTRRQVGTGLAPYLDMANMPSIGHRPQAMASRKPTSGAKFRNGDTLVARITPCLENGKTAFVDFLEEGQVGWGSTEYIVLAPKPPLPPLFGYLLARSERFRNFAIQNMSGSSGRQRVPVECFENYRIACPPPRLAQAFGQIIEPFFRCIAEHDNESRAISALRDLLLPKLISGEIRLKDAEKELAAL